jgi:hypothetical protein
VDVKGWRSILGLGNGMGIGGISTDYIHIYGGYRQNWQNSATFRLYIIDKLIKHDLPCDMLLRNLECSCRKLEVLSR